MYRISVIDRKSQVARLLSASRIWDRRPDFEYVGDTTDEDNAVAFLKDTNTSMVFINSDGRTGYDMPIISDIKTILPEVYIVLVSEDDSFKTVRSGFISGVFDYLLLPPEESAVESMLLRLYADLGSKYIYRELSIPINAFIEDIFLCNDTVGAYCRDIINRIYNYFSGDVLTAFIVSEKAKTFIYDEILRKAPWLKKFTFKDSFIHKTGDFPKNKGELIDSWTKDFRSILDTINKYRMLDNSLIHDIGYYVINNVDEKLSLDNVSKGVFLNKSYISHIFKKISGISFINFITQVKIDRAKILLMDPSLKIYEIAVRIGYNNPEYFSRVFKSVTGITPNKFRARLNIATE